MVRRHLWGLYKRMPRDLTGQGFVASFDKGRGRIPVVAVMSSPERVNDVFGILHLMVEQLSEMVETSHAMSAEPKEVRRGFTVYQGGKAKPQYTPIQDPGDGPAA